MGRVLGIIVCSIVLSLVVTVPILAQEPPTTPGQGPPEVVNLFSWLTTDPPDWRSGILFAVLGFFGALVPAYGLIGGVFPGTEGKARIESATKHLDQLQQLLDTWYTSPLATADPKTDPRIQDLRQTIDEERRTIMKEKWRQFAIATPLYALLGAFFAAAIAQDVLQALVIGTGWTTIAGTLGLRKDNADLEQAASEEARESIRREVEEELALAGATSALEEARSVLRDMAKDQATPIAQRTGELNKLTELHDRVERYLRITRQTSKQTSTPT
jgi:hypothetical protein